MYGDVEEKRKAMQAAYRQMRKYDLANKPDLAYEAYLDFLELRDEWKDAKANGEERDNEQSQ